MTHQKNAEYLKKYRQRRKQRAERELCVWLDSHTLAALDTISVEGSTAKKAEVVLQAALRDAYCLAALRSIIGFANR
ncbi:MAG: hypothetical protein Kow0065_10360 [Methylomicrobium sp.]